MKIAVVNNMVPFIRGGAENLAEYLVNQLEGLGHSAELIRIPFCYEPAEAIFSSMLAAQMMQIDTVDLVIALKFPAYFIQHPNKVVWLVHQYRQAYDMWDSGHTNLSASPHALAMKNSITLADNKCFASAQKLFAISTVTQARLKRYNGFDSQLLRTPLNGPEDFPVGNYGDYLFCGGRINDYKRQHLAVEAMRHCRSSAKLIVAGPAESDYDVHKLQRLVERYNLKDRVLLDLGFHKRSKVAKLACESLACVYLPIDEESLGYVSMEANQAGKAVLTATDSGGILDLVVPGLTGWVCPPDPQAIAISIDEAFTNRQRTIELGQAAREHWLKMEINWENTVHQLID